VGFLVQGGSNEVVSDTNALDWAVVPLRDENLFRPFCSRWGFLSR
jgi:hypothetical protein